MAVVSPLFSFDDVRLVLGGVTVLDRLTATLPSGRVVALVGPSGSGKSSMLRLCNRLEAPTSGVVRYRGDDVAGLDVRTLRRDVGMVFQRPTPFSGTVAENLRVGAPDLSDSEAAGLLVSVGLGDEFLLRDATTLSGGEAQRVCAARSLATRPKALLLDEPTSALDEDAARGIESLARSLVDEHAMSIVWVSHDRPQVDRIADVVVRLDGGRIVEGP